MNNIRRQVLIAHRSYLEQKPFDDYGNCRYELIGSIYSLFSKDNFIDEFNELCNDLRELGMVPVFRYDSRSPSLLYAILAKKVELK